MGKALKTVGTIVGGAVLIATGVGALMGVNVAAMGIASITGSMTVGQLGLLSSGLSAVGSYLEKPKGGGAAAPTDWTANADQPTPFAFGRVGVAGKIVHRDEYGKDNKLQGIVSVFSGAGPIKGFVSYKAGDLPVTFVSNGGTANGKYNRQMWRSWRLGAQPDTALSLPTGLDDGAVMPGWGSAYRLSGKACDLLTLQQDSKLSVYPGNVEPKPLVVLDGVHGYDPRYDSTYPGGLGDCRLGVRSTYRFIENPIIGGLNWSLGMIENGKVVGGIGASPDGIDLAAFVECANVADANGWKVTAWPDTSEDVSVVLDQFLQAGGAVRSRVAGKISCVTRGAPRASIVTITRRDTAGPIELDTGASQFNRLNTIVPRFMSEAAGWKLTPADPVTFESLRTEDGGRRGDKIDYRFVPALKQAAELAAYDILDPREPFSGTIPLKPHLRRLKPGDCFDIDEPGFLMDGVKCLVLSRAYDPAKGEVRIAFRSETDGKHDLALGKTTTLPDYPELTPADPTEVTPAVPGDWIVQVPAVVPGSPTVPTIEVVGEVGNATADSVIIETGPSNAGPWSVAYEGPPTTERVPLTGIQPGQTYYVAVSYRRGNNYSAKTIYGPYTAPDLVASDTVNVGGEPVEEVIERLSDAEAAISEGLEAAEGRVAAVRAALMRQTERLFAELARAKVGVLSEQKVRVAEMAVQIGRIDGLIARMDDAEAGITAAEALIATLEEVTVDLENPSSLASQLALLASSLDTVEGDLAAQITTINTTLTQQGADLSSLAGELEILDDGLIALQGEVEDQGDALSEAQGDIADNASGLLALSGRADLIEAEVDALGDGLDAHTAQIGSVSQAVATNFAAGTYQAQWAAARTARAGASVLAERILRVTDTAAIYTDLEAIELNLGDDIAGALSRLDTVELDLDGKASVSSVTNLGLDVDDLSADLTDVAELAIDVDGRLKAFHGVLFDVNGYISGTVSENDGESASFTVLTDKFELVDPGSGERTEYREGNWHIYSPDDDTRTRYGKAFGGSQKLVWWTGPDSVDEGDESKSNAYVYISQNTVGGPRFGGSDVVAGGGSTSKAAGVFGAIGRGAGNVAAGSLTMTVPSGGHFQIQLNGRSQSSLDGSSTQQAIGTVTLVITHSGGSQSGGGSVTVTTSTPDPGQIIDFSSLNRLLANVGAGTVTFTVRTEGGGPGTSATGSFNGGLVVTYFPA